MALNFPTSPSTGDVHQASNSLSYFFDGVKWTTQGTYNTGTINAVKLDSLTSSFNGSLTTFNLTSNNVAVKPANAQSVQISLGNVIQEPVTAYTIDSVQGTITFASAPASNTAFFGIVFSRLPIDTTVTNVSDGVITDIKIASDAAIAQSKLNISDATTSASGFMSSTDKTKLNGIESNATADQTDEEIQDIVGAMVSGNTESGITVTYQDSDGTLDFSVASQTDNNFTDADHTKLDGIEASATADQTASEIVSLLSDQNITTTGRLQAGTAGGSDSIFNSNLRIENTFPTIYLNDTDTDNDFYIRNSNGVFNVHDVQASANRIEINSSGTVTVAQHMDIGAGLDVTGNIGASGNVTASGFLSSTGGLNTNGDVVIGNDTAKLKLGTSDDLQIYHNGSNSYIDDNGTGNLEIRTVNGTKVTLQGGTDAMLNAIKDGAVQLYYDGALKAETRSDGFEIKQHLTMGDSDEIRLGNSSDLKIYHDGSNSIIEDTGTGQLRLCGDNAVVLRKSPTGDVYALGNADGSFELFYDNSKKIETSSSGVTVTGNVVASGTLTGVSTSSVPALTAKGDGSSQDGYIQLNCSQNSHGVKIKAPPHSAAASYTLTLPDTDGSANQVLKTDGSGNLSWVNQSSGGGGSSIGGDTGVDFNDNVKARFGTGNDLEIYHDGTNSYLVNGASGGILYLQAYGENSLKAHPNGQVELFYDASKKFETTSGGVTVTGNVFVTGSFRGDDNSKLDLGNSNDLQIYHDGSNSLLANSTGRLIVHVNGNESAIDMHPNGAVELYYDNTKRLETKSDGARFTGHLYANDNEKIRLGTGHDLEIYHSGSHSFIKDSGTGNLQMWTNQLSLLNSGGTESMIQAVENAQVELYYDNSKKFETTSSGVKVFGDASTGTIIQGAFSFRDTTSGSDRIKWIPNSPYTLRWSDNFNASFGSGDDLKIYHNGTDSFIENSTGELFIKTTTKFNLRSDGNEAMIVATPNGAVELKYDNSTKLETTNVGISITGNIDLTAELNLTGGSDAQRYIDAAVGTSALTFRGCTGGDANHQEMARFFRGGGCELNHAGTKKLETASGGVTITGLLTATASNLETGEFGMTTASGTPQSRFMDFGFLNNSLNMRRTNGGEAGHTNFLTVASSLTVSGDLNDTSDEKLKKNIASIADGAIAIIKQLRPVTFDWIDENRNNNVSGFIAQEVKTVLPNLVYGTEYDPSLVDETKGSKGGIKSEGYSVNTVGITAHLTKALQEAIAKIEILETKVATLEAA